MEPKAFKDSSRRKARCWSTRKVCILRVYWYSIILLSSISSPSLSTSTYISLNSVSNIPIEAKAVFKYASDSDTGAILLASSPISLEGYYHENAFKDWVKQNTAALLKKYPEILSYGLWVVTVTYTTRQCSRNVWVGKKKELTVGFAVNAAGIGGIGPAGAWYEDESDGDWAHFSSSGGEQLRVPVFEGHEFRFKKRPWTDVSFFHIPGLATTPGRWLQPFL